MSEDLKILIECDHRVVDERMSIDAIDGKTVRFAYPLANSNLSVRINGYLIEPLNRRYGFATVNAQGQEVLNFFTNELSVEPKTQKLVFNKTLNQDDIIQISYTAPLGYCRKCFGTSLVYDYQEKENGSGFYTVSGISKLRQDCLKAVSTIKGSNAFHAWVGTTLDSLVGNKYNQSLLFDLKQDIGTTLNNLKRLQVAQSTYQKVSSDELLQTIDSIILEVSTYDPTLLLIEIQITSASGQSIAISQAFKSTGSVSGLLNA